MSSTSQDFYIKEDKEISEVEEQETREERIRQFHEIPGSKPVLGLREGSYLIIEGDSIILKGKPGVLFVPNKEPEECPENSDLSKTAAIKQIS